MPSTDFEAEKSIFRDFYNDQIRLLQEATTFFQSLVTAVLRDTVIEIDAVTSRVKDREECILKFTRKYREQLEEEKVPYEIMEWISDLIGVRVVCLYEGDVYAVEKILKDNFDLVDETDKKKTMEASEGSFGYKGVHLDLRLGGGRENLAEYKRYRSLQFEVQIRTISQDAWSTLDHKIKYKKSIPLELKRRINRLAALFELADQEFSNIRDNAKIELQRGEDLAAQLEGAQPPAVASQVHDTVDVFGFMGVARRWYPTFQFLEDRADSFLQEVRKVAPELTTAQFADALKNNLQKVRAYKATVTFRMNPFTEIRHALFAHDQAAFSSLLFPMQRQEFENWLKDNPTQAQV